MATFAMEGSAALVAPSSAASADAPTTMPPPQPRENGAPTGPSAATLASVAAAANLAKQAMFAAAPMGPKMAEEPSALFGRVSMDGLV